MIKVNKDRDWLKGEGAKLLRILFLEIKNINEN
jgi:hypothetical protein